MNNKAYVLYVGDAYCGWCYGFGPRLHEVETANRERVAFRVISGGLFIGDRSRPIREYPHIPEANARIARTTGVQFGPAYNALLQDGSFVMDSTAAGAGLAALRAQDERRGIELFQRMQEAFYVDGRSLSDTATYLAIAEAAGLDPCAVERMLSSGEAARQAEGDFTKAAALGVKAYPALCIVKGDTAQKLPGVGSALHVINESLDKAMLNLGRE